MPLLYSIHDRDSHPIIPAGGWCVDAVLVTDTPPNYAQIRSDINWIVRLNNGWHPNGTIPLRSGYAEYAKRCADFVQRSKGVDWFIISNEVNHLQEQPHGVPITPDDYSDCFNACYAAIKTLRKDANVGVAAIAPWDVTSGMDWLAYYRRMLAYIDECDFLALHGYTHGADPDLIWSYEKVNGWYWHFPTIVQQLDQVPVKFSHKPVHVTETNQGDNAWADTDSGWVVEAYEAINTHNRTLGRQKIWSLSLYRWRGDKWEIHNKPQVQADFRAAVELGYESPGREPDQLPDLPVEPTEPPVEPTPEPDQEIDPALIARGVTVTEAPSSPHWHLAVANFLNEDESGGRHHIYIETVDADYRPVPGINFLAKGQGSETSGVTNDKLGFDAANVPMWASEGKNGYTVYLDNGDTIAGLGMGDETEGGFNAGIHTSTILTYQFVETEPAPPTTPPHTEFVTAIAGANLRAAPVDGLVLDTLPYRTACTVVNETATQSDGYMWHGVNYKHHYGFIQSILLDVRQPDPIVPEPPIVPAPGRLVHPLPGSRITQHWGENGQNYARWSMWGHNGLDLGGRPTGTPILSMAAGRVVYVGYDHTGYGHHVEIAHEALQASTVYCHASEIAVEFGQMVAAGATVALLGSSGNSSGPHCHVEVRLRNPDGSYRDGTPMPKGRCDPETWAIMHGLEL